MKFFSHDSRLEDGVTVSRGGPLDRRGLEIGDPEKREPWTGGALMTPSISCRLPPVDLSIKHRKSDLEAVPSIIVESRVIIPFYRCEN